MTTFRLYTLVLLAMLAQACGKSDSGPTGPVPLSAAESAPIVPNCTSENQTATILYYVLDTASETSNIWSIKQDGTQMMPLTQYTTPGIYAFGAGYSPDGSRISFAATALLDGSWASASYRAWVMNRDGTNQRALTSASSFPGDFSNDGEKIYVSSRAAIDGEETTSGSANIWLIDLASTQGRPLTHNTEASLNSSWPKLSPDGSKLVFKSTTALDEGWDGTSTGSPNIWAMDVADDSLTPLTQHTAIGAKDANYPYDFSSDSRYLLYGSFNHIDGSWNTAVGAHNIWMVDTLSGERTVLTKNTIVGNLSGGAQFSPDGSKILYYSNTALDGAWNGTAGPYNIWIMDRDGSNRKALTLNSQTGLDSAEAAFTPDGKKIVFYSNTALDGAWNGTAAGSSNIWIMNSDGSDRKPLTRNSLPGLDSRTVGHRKSIHQPNGCTSLK